jgi:PAS domain S-box-containing protein
MGRFLRLALVTVLLVTSGSLEVRLHAQAGARGGPAVPGFWQHYGVYVLAAALFCGVEAILIAALLVQRSRRRVIEARNDAILRALPDMLFLQSKDGVYLDYRAQASQLLLPAERFLGRNMREVLPPPFLATIEPHFLRAASGRSIVVFEYDLELDGDPRSFEARLVPTGNQVLTLVRDITERNRSRAALRRSEQRLALATAAGGVGVWDWNLKSDEIYIDPSLKALLGFEDTEVRNHFDDWVQRIHPDDVHLVVAQARAHIAGETPSFEVEHRMLHKDGSARWFLARGLIVRGESGTPDRIIGTSTDVTARKDAETALHDAQAELSRMSRLAALGEFAGAIAHEVRQPLTAVLLNARSCLRWLRSETPALAEIEMALQELIESAQRADGIVTHNRDLFRHRTIEKSSLDINAVILEVMELARARLLGAQVALDARLAPGLPAILGDRIELQQVLLNFIINAVEAMSVIDPSSRRMAITSSLQIDAVQVSVSDTGVGLDAVDRKRLFTPSYTTKSGGTGIGLSISRTIVEAHGGRIWAEQNGPGGGATFSFTVPVVGAMAAG